MLPSVPEQETLSTFFRSLDNLITLHQRDENNVAGMPENRLITKATAWEQRKLEELVERIVRKNTNNESKLPLTISAQDGLVDQITYFNNRVASRDVSNYYLVLNGEFAYNKSTSDGYPFGAVKRLDLYEKGVLSTLYIVFGIKNIKEVNSDFLTVFFDSDRWHKGVAERAAEGARNHGLLNISAENFFDIDLYLPMDFHHQLKGAIMDAVDEGLIERDPTRKAIIKGKTPSAKKIKYLNQFELHTLLINLNLKSEINYDWMILLIAKTGMRFSEALALTPKDFDFSHQTLSISKTWDYKGDGGFLPTKNTSSVRKIQIDWQTVIQFSELVKPLNSDEPIFVNKDKVYNSTVNDLLARHCKKAKLPVISIHGLRHTHASLLLFAGVSIASVARRLGHASMTTTQRTYLHIIQELENQDVDLVMRSISGLS
jgi:site-specific recombinase XerD